MKTTNSTNTTNNANSTNRSNRFGVLGLLVLLVMFVVLYTHPEHAPRPAAQAVAWVPAVCKRKHMGQSVVE